MKLIFLIFFLLYCDELYVVRVSVENLSATLRFALKFSTETLCETGELM